MSRIKNERSRAVILALAERWPAAFFPIGGLQLPRPLKLGTRDTVLEAMPDLLGVHAALGYYFAQPCYRRVSVPGAVRIDLDGNPAGQVTIEEAEAAETARRADQLARKEKKRRKRELERAARAKIQTAPKVEPIVEITAPSVEIAAQRLASEWNVASARVRPIDRQTPRFTVEVKRRRVVLTARDRFEHGR